MNLLFPCPSSWSSGGRGCCADSQVCVPGGDALPPGGCGLSGSSLPCEAPVPWWPHLSRVHSDTRRNNTTGGGQLSSPGVSSPSNYHSSQSAGAWMLWGWGPPICTARGPPVAGPSSLSCALPASACPGEGGGGSWAMSPGALGSRTCAAGIVFPGPPKTAGRSPLSWSCPLTNWLLPETPRGALQPFTPRLRCVGRSPPVHLLCSDPGTWGLHCPSCGVARVPCQHLSFGEEPGVDF